MNRFPRNSEEESNNAHEIACGGLAKHAETQRTQYL
jgi:hypothetical protein